MSKFLFGASLICAVIQFAKCAEYLTERPDYIEKCRFKDSDYTACFTRGVQKWFDKLAHDGIPTVPSIDPYIVKTVVLDTNDGTRAANLKAVFSNLKVLGMNEAVIKESKINLPKPTWDIKAIIPKMHVDGDYKLDGNILLVPLRGQGKISVDMDDIKVHLRTKGTPYKIGDLYFVNVTSVVVKRADVTGMKTHLDNLFNGNKELEDSTNALLNENWKDFYEALKPTIHGAIAEAMLSMLQAVTRYIPMNFAIEDIADNLN